MARMFDELELLDRVDQDLEFLVDIVRMLGDDGLGLIEQIRQAIESDDSEAAGRHAHTLKGMISNFSAPEAQAQALDLEKMVAAGEFASAPAKLSELEKTLHALIDDLNTFVREKGS